MHGMSPMKRMQGSSPNNVAGPVGQEIQTALVAIHKVMTTVAKEILMELIHVLEEVEAVAIQNPEGRYFRAKADATAYLLLDPTRVRHLV
ncbi:hypothetical protein SEMRO_882_G215410.1 [Seminavis robusta]|uniref:Uncharacterized protein n=1 Tax=Seminavis robusta TaxID=568900 RepID=A0A9N8EB10_9STRA|nr:hypothetical protein SEMRO_882_G215410.1 [Seminavis robusta]|eukprot:Sro882_g215410.1 n/a (90) ;mRNA; r:43668-43937